jgi:hypothetical protein
VRLVLLRPMTGKLGIWLTSKPVAQMMMSKGWMAPSAVWIPSALTLVIGVLVRWTLLGG